MLTTRQTAALLGVSTITLRRYFRQGLLRPLKLPGGEYRITQEELERFLKACEPEGAALEDHRQEKASTAGNGGSDDG